MTVQFITNLFNQGLETFQYQRKLPYYLFGKVNSLQNTCQFHYNDTYSNMNIGVTLR